MLQVQFEPDAGAFLTGNHIDHQLFAQALQQWINNQANQQNVPVGNNQPMNFAYNGNNYALTVTNPMNNNVFMVNTIQ